jgi:cell fate regulator YaaT (PSP1 superfamily)
LGVSRDAPGIEGLEARYLHWLDEPAPVERRLLRRVLVRLVRSGRLDVYDGGDMGLTPGDSVLVDTPAGRQLGAVEGRPIVVLHDGAPPPAVLRRASSGDRHKDRALRDREEQAWEVVKAEIERHRLPMQLINVHMPHGGNRATVYFVAEGRVEFRKMVKDLARQLRCRVEMRQIGSRDAASQLGGAGICGLELCCTTWLKGFNPVSIRHAKSQRLEMQLDKHQGICGRLMCCLVYEHAQYKAMRKGLPKVGKIIETPMGEGRVREVNVMLRKIRVQVGRSEYKTFTAEELGLPPPAEEVAETPPPPSANKGRTRSGGGDRGRPDDKEGAPPWRRSSRRRRRRRSGGGKPKPD